jgi:hypothetical protein
MSVINSQGVAISTVPVSNSGAPGIVSGPSTAGVLAAGATAVVAVLTGVSRS